jgi:penicillin-binding protein 1A
MLAGLPKAPSAYNPIVNPKRATMRQQYIIDRMLEERLHHRRAARRRAAPGAALPHAHRGAGACRVRGRDGAPAGVRAVRRRGLHARAGRDLTIRSGDQEVAYRALRRGLLDYEQRQWYRGPEAYVTCRARPEALDARIAEALAEHPDNGELRAAVVLEASPRKVVAMLQVGETLTVTGDGLKPVTSGLSDQGRAEAADPPRRGGACAARRQGRLDADPAARGRRRVRGARSAHRRHPRAGGRLRLRQEQVQPRDAGLAAAGLGFKPFIYSAALEKGFTPATVVNDAPLFFDAGTTGSQPWEPKNYDGKFDGPMPLRTALAKSKNMVSIRLLQRSARSSRRNGSRASASRPTSTRPT